MSEITFARLSPQLQRDIVMLIDEGRAAIAKAADDSLALSDYERLCAASLLLVEVMGGDRWESEHPGDVELRDAARHIVDLTRKLYLTKQARTS